MSPTPASSTTQSPAAEPLGAGSRTPDTGAAVRRGRATPRRDTDPVRVYADGRVAYWTGRVPGEGKRVFTRPRHGQLADELRRDLGTPSLDKGGRTVMQLFQAWRDAQPADHATTRKVRSDASNHILPVVGLVRNRDLTLADLIAVIDRALAAGLALNTVKAIRTSFATVVTWGRARGWFGTVHPFGSPEERRNAVERAMRLHYDALLAEEPIETFDVEVVPMPAEIEALAAHFDAIRDGAGHHIRALAASGLRVAEYVALRVDDVDLDRMRLKLRRQARRDRRFDPAAPDAAGDSAWTARLKGRRRRQVQVWESARPSLTWLVEHAEHGWLVPPSNAQAWWLDAFNRAVNKGCAAQGWDDGKRCHWLRLFYGTYCLAPEPVGYGFDVSDVSRWMGHQSTATTQNMYRHSTAGADDRACATLVAGPGELVPASPGCGPAGGGGHVVSSVDCGGRRARRF